ncbi:MAG: leucyl aminopeptidase [Rhodothermales bacterium]|nr:leucyl aminopeptidase [Rhodothermales bacterium]
MKVSVTTIPFSELDVDLLLVPVSKDDFTESVAALKAAFGESVSRALCDFDGELSKSVVLYPEKARARRLAMIGLGDKTAADTEIIRQMAAEGAAMAIARQAETVAFVIPNAGLDPETTSQALVEGFVLGSYRYEHYKTQEEEKTREIQRLVLHVSDAEKTCRLGAERGRVIAECVITARDLINLSPDEKTATALARAAEKSAKKFGYGAWVWDKVLIEEEKMGGLLAVNKGSVEPPTFTVLTWEPENPVNQRPIVLVGKGVVFDTGGLSLKPTKDSMDYMKSDMSGAAAVIGTFEAVARLDLPVHLIGLIPATDNRPGLQAYVPGEVVRMHSGATVEVLNTDAEGRMLLADALSYARTYKPELVIDIATLTGAAVISLGKDVAAVMTNEGEGAQTRIEMMEEAGQRSGDRVHRMPMYADFKRALKSDVADLKNVGGREASSITAAKFLEHFVDYPWIHLDIAGPAFLHEAKPYRPRGGTGFGVRLLVDFLRTLASPKKRR